MARAFSGVLGALALCLVLVRGLVTGTPANEVLAHGLVVFLAFSVLGFLIGWMADRTVRESVENRFRMEVARLQSAAAGKQSEGSEQQG